MNLLAALFMNQLLYVIGVGGVPDSELCIAISFSMQYVRLCTFCWILAMTHHMNAQFKSNLNLVPCDDHAIGKHFVRYSLFAWGIPAILLGASVFIQYRDKAGKLLDTASLKTHNCWFLDTNALVYGLLIPSTVLVIITLTYVIRGAIVARYVISMQVDRKVRNKMRKKRTLQVVLFTKITMILTLVVTLGALSKFFKLEAVWISYNTVQSLQGIIIAMLVTCNCHVLKIYTRSIQSSRGKYITNFGKVSSGPKRIFNKSSAITKSTSLQLLTWDPVPDSV
uniref:G-protein coupled receptors family 2 profile 2 domain-containing protein n=1 Tax=Photinus pyralis TaxID=7054 RepID=A0A1Y1KGY6_PHOPY